MKKYICPNIRPDMSWWGSLEEKELGFWAEKQTLLVGGDWNMTRIFSIYWE